ncbi:hypothetical protein A1353_04390 [Methylomonas methanica]|uniref:Uncharacterized protein n=1 Tax=Methylomonas methanica TaxID=421 RepID=A0A177MVW7_METMH|nr:hypothetical protein A1353_04390 [Methylomonas methanica]
MEATGKLISDLYFPVLVRWQSVLVRNVGLAYFGAQRKACRRGIRSAGTIRAAIYAVQWRTLGSLQQRR